MSDRVPFEIGRDQMHRDYLNANPVERHRFQHLELSAARLQAHIINISVVHCQEQRIQRETFDPSVEPIRFVDQAVGMDAVDAHAVPFLLVESDLFRIGRWTQAGVDRLRFDAVMATQIEEMARVWLY